MSEDSGSDCGGAVTSLRRCVTDCVTDCVTQYIIRITVFFYYEALEISPDSVFPLVRNVGFVKKLVHCNQPVISGLFIGTVNCFKL